MLSPLNRILLTELRSFFKLVSVGDRPIHKATTIIGWCDVYYCRGRVHCGNIYPGCAVTRPIIIYSALSTAWSSCGLYVGYVVGVQTEGSF
jgi:hypothetical protein